MKKIFLMIAAMGAAGFAAAQTEVTQAHIANPSFEDGLAGWEYSAMQTQTNSYFSIKDGRTYAESWVDRGRQLGDHSLSQRLQGLAPGRYRLSAASLHIQQSQANSAVNAGDAQTGACIFANDYACAIDTMTTRSLDFILLGAEAEIGMRAVGATGNWVCVDNFHLFFLGDLAKADVEQALQDKIGQVAAALSTLHAGNAAIGDLEAAIAAARLVADNGSSMEMADFLAAAQEAIAAMDAKLDACRESSKAYDALSDRIAHANRVIEWIEGEDEKIAALQQAIAEAQAAYGNLDASPEALAQAIAELNKAIRAADKEIYTPQWSLGNINDPNNSWYIGRTIESKNWILFWEKPYGDEVPVNAACGPYKVNAWDAIEHAQTAFDFYADSLRYINRATSKTNQYKMVIKLRYSESEWEATGSGVDDLIGLLTLTPWAMPSRNWQTLYHEVGHCFQYQTHCDNGDMNGWMYTVGQKGCAFWEQCAQWQAYKILPYDQFTNEWHANYLANANKHILHEAWRYNNYMVMDYWTMLHGWDFMGRLWNESVKPEDAVQAYQRITGISNDEFNDEMWDCAARFATWDIPHLEPYHRNAWTRRQQPAMTLEDEYWYVNPEAAVENTGHNIIQLNVPDHAVTVSAAFQGLAGHDRYRPYYMSKAGWRYGFVALLKDGTRVYGTPGKKATYNDPDDVVTFDCPDNCERLWFVVSGAAKDYRVHGWDDNDKNDEQYGYQVMFDNTNLKGQPDHNFNGIVSILADQPAAQGIYNMQGVKVREAADLDGLHSGIYIVNGKKIIIAQ